MEAIKALLNNGAFWIFLGTCVTAYFTYKGLLLPYQKRNKPQVMVRNASTFEELKAAVELLQTISERKDKQHSTEVSRLLKRIEDLETANGELYDQVEHLKDRLRKAHINHE